MNKIPAYAAQEAKGEVSPFSIERRKLGPNDVNIEIEYCGVCHTDLHFVNNDWGRSMYPIVPGHEIVVGSQQSERQSRNSRSETWQRLVAWLMRAASARIVLTEMNNTA